MPTPAWPVYADTAVTLVGPQVAGLRRLQSGLITPIADSKPSFASATGAGMSDSYTKYS
jgi:hypothetical protein